jgi:uncharacterized membrane protein
METAEILRGKWLKHPLHPIFAHMPVALWPAALLFDLLSRLKSVGNIMVELSFFCIVLGLASAFLALPTGLTEWSGIKKSNPAWKLALYHMILNVLVVLLFLVNFGLRLGTFRTDGEVALAPLILTIFGVVLLFWSGYLGGVMVYDYGVGVARYSKSKWRRLAVEGGSNVPKES